MVSVAVDEDQCAALSDQISIGLLPTSNPDCDSSNMAVRPRSPSHIDGLVFIVNPASASGRAGKVWSQFEKIVQRLTMSSEKLVVKFTEKANDAKTFARTALQGGAKGVVAIGGDGTLHEVVNGFFENGVNLFPDRIMGFVPCGTGGDFKRTLGWDGCLEAAARRLISQNIKALDVGICKVKQQPGSNPFSGDRYFINVSSIGSSAIIAGLVNESPKYLGSFVTFYSASLRGLMSFKPHTIRFRKDGGAWEEVEKVFCIAVCNGRYFGGGMMVGPKADVHDGLLDITIWAGFSLVSFVALTNLIYSGKHVDHPKTRTFRCSSFEIANDGESVELDGEVVDGPTPQFWRVVPRAIRFIS